ncbi:DUF4386 domain-containing protein [Algoriphagus sp.]|uniref:DUF4386 domain-containing protein n=1 Tax=Algoriphagus sp. TaxID=1872435 RepID=UPI00391871BE
MNRHSARLFGIFFILSFVSYATGIELMSDLLNTQLQAFQVAENKVGFIIGAILIAVFHTLSNLGMVIIMFHVLQPVSHSLSLMYLVLGSFGTFLLTLGAVFLLLPIPISEALDETSLHDASFLSMLLTLSSSGNFYSYQLGMILWACGGLIFCSLLFKSKLVPVFFPIWGFLGYLIFIIGCGLELVGQAYGVILSIPGGLFEIILSIWLIAKGFKKPEVVKAVNV